MKKRKNKTPVILLAKTKYPHNCKFFVCYSKWQSETEQIYNTTITLQESLEANDERYDGEIACILRCKISEQEGASIESSKINIISWYPYLPKDSE
jgi:hypothetical protein